MEQKLNPTRQINKSNKKSCNLTKTINKKVRLKGGNIL